MKTNILQILLVVFFFMVFFNLFVADVLHMQNCVAGTPADGRLSCEEEVAEEARNCRYVFLFWQKVEPMQKDVDACKQSREHETNNKNN